MEFDQIITFVTDFYRTFGPWMIVASPFITVGILKFAKWRERKEMR